MATAAVWTLFGVPDDPWLPGADGHNVIEPLVPIPGWLRFAMEIATFALATAAFWDVGAPAAGVALAGGAVVHYPISYQRVAWLFSP